MPVIGLQGSMLQEELGVVAGTAIAGWPVCAVGLLDAQPASGPSSSQRSKSAGQVNQLHDSFAGLTGCGRFALEGHL